jgi:hypothetical protein
LLELQGQRSFRQLDKKSDTQFAFNLLTTFLPAPVIKAWLVVTSAIHYNSLLTPRMREPAVPLQRTRLVLGAIVTVSVSPTKNEELYIGLYEIANTIPFAHPLPPFRT